MLATLKSMWTKMVSWVKMAFGVADTDAQAGIATVKTDVNTVKTDVTSTISSIDSSKTK